MPGSRESLRSVAGTVEEMVEYGYPDDYFDHYASKVKALRTADVNDVAKTVLHPDHLIWIIVGDRAKIEAGVRADRGKVGCRVAAGTSPRNATSVSWFSCSSTGEPPARGKA